MSDEESKFKRSKRLAKTETKISRQLKIVMSKERNWMDANERIQRYLREKGRFAKRHAMDCGRPKCKICGNPRHNPWLKKEALTYQERKLFQHEIENEE